jgi:hypothetical protein
VEAAAGAALAVGVAVTIDELRMMIIRTSGSGWG